MTALITGSLALTGMNPVIPHRILLQRHFQTATTSHANARALLVTLVATPLTAVCSTWIIFLLLGQPHFPTLILFFYIYIFKICTGITNLFFKVILLSYSNLNKNNPCPTNSIKHLLNWKHLCWFLYFQQYYPNNYSTDNYALFSEANSPIRNCTRFCSGIWTQPYTQNLKLIILQTYSNSLTFLDIFQLSYINSDL